MLTHISKNTIIFISFLSLVFLPVEVFASPLEKLLETLHSRPQPEEVPPKIQEFSSPIIIIPEVPALPMTPVGIPQNNTLKDPFMDNKAKFIPITPIPQQSDIFKQEEPKLLLDEVLIEDTTTEPELAIPGLSLPGLSLTDFLIKTVLEEQKKSKTKDKPAQSVKEIPPVKVEPKPKEIPPVKVEPPIKEIPPAKNNPSKSKKGDTLVIPESAKKTKNVDFLEGCWVGNRPEYSSKRMITERFCFDDKGIGKRYVEDPTYAGICIGSTKALINKDGLLYMDSEIMYCSPSGEQWGGSKMQCQGEGEQTPCTWVFKDADGARQSYKITFVRE